MNRTLSTVSILQALSLKNGVKISLTACFCLLNFSVSVFATQLPDLGAPDLIEYDQQTETALGRAFTTSLHTQYRLNYDPEVISYVRDIGHKIASLTGQQRHFRFYVIDNDAINAFAGPNGIIGIHTGLIKAVENEDELASVIAHEISHITQRHLSRRYEYQNSQGNLASAATLLAAVLIGIQDPNAGMAALMGGMGLNLEHQLKNSRLHEAEADSEGIQLLNKAGYNPHAMGNFFKRLAKAGQNNSFSLPEILRTHPVTDRRLAEAENRAQLLPSLKATPPNNSLDLIKARLNNKDNHLDQQGFNPTRSAEERCYQENLDARRAAFKKTHSNTSLACLARLATKHPEQALYSNLLAESAIKTDGIDKAIMSTALDQAELQLALRPQNTAALLRYTDLLIKTDRTKRAIQLLIEHTDRNPYQYLAYQKLAELHTQKQQEAQAYYFHALAQMNIGNIERSQYLMKQADKIAKKSDVNLKLKIKLFFSKYAKLLKNKNKA